MTNVFVVIGGWKWDGSDADTIRVFATREMAEEYSTGLTKTNEGGFTLYDFSEIIELPVWAPVEGK